MDKINLTEALKKLEDINEWFESQEEIDVELGLEKVKEGVKLVKESQKRLREVENEFEAVKKDLVDTDTAEEAADEDTNDPETIEMDIEKIPF